MGICSGFFSVPVLPLRMRHSLTPKIPTGSGCVSSRSSAWRVSCAAYRVFIQGPQCESGAETGVEPVACGARWPCTPRLTPARAPFPLRGGLNGRATQVFMGSPPEVDSGLGFPVGVGSAPRPARFGLPSRGAAGRAGRRHGEPPYELVLARERRGWPC